MSRRSIAKGLMAGATASLWGLSASADDAPDGDAAAPGAGTPRGDFRIEELTVPGDREIGTRMTLLLPEHLPPGQRAPLLVLLHGLGETHAQEVGIYAWLDRYGLETSYRRLLRPPLVAENKRGDWTPARLAAFNRALALAPLRGMAIACPFTPNVGKLSMGRAAAIEGYATWIREEVIPAARKHDSVLSDARYTLLDGCSLGGYLSLEVFLRSPETFGAVGIVQGAFGTHRVAGYAQRLTDALSRHAVPLRISTSQGDPFHDANVALASALEQGEHDVTLHVAPGPHDQPWLRDTGTPEMLYWHDRRPRPT